MQGLTVIGNRIALQWNHVPNHPELYNLLVPIGEVVENDLAHGGNGAAPFFR